MQALVVYNSHLISMLIESPCTAVGVHHERGLLAGAAHPVIILLGTGGANGGDYLAIGVVPAPAGRVELPFYPSLTKRTTKKKLPLFYLGS